MQDQGRVDHVCHGLALDRHGAPNAHTAICGRHRLLRSWLDRDEVKAVERGLPLATDATQATKNLRRHAANAVSNINSRRASVDPAPKAVASRARRSEPGGGDSPGGGGGIPRESTGNQCRLARQPSGFGT